MSTSTPLSLDETVGITEYLHPELSSITGILKQRFSDFIVREVTTNNEVLVLRDISGAELEKSIFASKPAEPAQEEEANEDAKVETPVEEKLFNALATVYGLTAADQDDVRCSNLTEDTHAGTVASLKQFLALAVQRDESSAPEWIGFPTTDKATRSALHKTVREIAGATLDSTTVTLGDASSASYFKLIAKHKQGRGGKAQQGQGQAAFNTHRNKRKLEQWPEKECGGNYLQFTLLKENIDTMSAINVLSKSLHTKPEYIMYNGTKDKRGVTTQLVTVYRRKPSDFAKINAYPHLPTIRVGDFQFVKDAAKLGKLNGNRFEIVLRAVRCATPSASEGDALTEDRNIELACEYLKSHGFINYFGLQRFGKGGSKSHEIGRAIFQSNWRECVERLFTHKDNDRDNVRHAKELFFQRAYSKAASLLPEAMYAEKCVLRQLAKTPEDWQAAYHAIGNKGTRLICAHAYQSFLFNKAASKRVRDFGLAVVAGDLVIPTESDALLVAEDNDSEDVPVAAEEEKEKEPELEPESNNKRSKRSTETASDLLQSLVHVVTEEEAANKTFSLDQVVLPLAGSESIFPTHSVGAYFVELLKEDGLSLETFAKCFPTYRMRGSYRKLIQKAGNVEWAVKTYTDPHAELVETELNAFRVARASNGERAESMENAKELKALLLKFTLPPGTYATMLLREVTKQSTESDFHAQLTANVDKGQ